ncbi:MAG: hypothetical protein II059_07230 [Clostridia bacterium]|nr:hypothetical protein [Clostridia bacterium]
MKHIVNFITASILILSIFCFHAGAVGEVSGEVSHEETSLSESTLPEETEQPEQSSELPVADSSVTEDSSTVISEPESSVIPESSIEESSHESSEQSSEQSEEQSSEQSIEQSSEQSEEQSSEQSPEPSIEVSSENSEQSVQSSQESSAESSLEVSDNTEPSDDEISFPEDSQDGTVSEVSIDDDKPDVSYAPLKRDPLAWISGIGTVIPADRSGYVSPAQKAKNELAQRKYEESKEAVEKAIESGSDMEEFVASLPENKVIEETDYIPVHNGQRSFLIFIIICSLIGLASTSFMIALLKVNEKKKVKKS